MRVPVALGVLVALAGCRTPNEQPATTLIGAKGAGGAASPMSPTAPARCALAGDYRLRFASNGADGWWWRFRVTGDDTGLRGKLLAPIPVLGIAAAAALDVRRGPAGCAMTVTAPGSLGDMTATLVLDAPTGKVTGQLTRAKPRDADEQKPTPMAGVRDVPGATPGGPGACIVPGTYELALDPKAKYESDTRGEKCFCTTNDLRIRLDYLGPELFGDSVDEQGNDEWPGSVVIRSFNGGCDVELEHTGENRFTQVIAKLTFSGARVVGEATRASYTMLEDGEGAHKIWKCTAANVAISGRRLQ